MWHKWDGGVQLRSWTSPYAYNPLSFLRSHTALSHGRVRQPNCLSCFLPAVIKWPQRHLKKERCFLAYGFREYSIYGGEGRSMRPHCVFSQEAKRESPAGFSVFLFFFFSVQDSSCGRVWLTFGGSSSVKTPWECPHRHVQTPWCFKIKSNWQWRSTVKPQKQARWKKTKEELKQWGLAKQPRWDLSAVPESED